MVITVFLALVHMFSITGTASHALAVWLSSTSAPAVAPGTFEMRNVSRTFTPAIIVIPVGSQVRFPNDDPFEHSIYSSDKVNGFDIGYYGTGPGKYVTFSHSGVVQVRCHIHGYMHAMIVVTGGPFGDVLGGVYQIPNVPAGEYTVHEVTDDGIDHTSHVVLKGNQTINF